MAQRIQAVAGQVAQAVGLVDDSPVYKFPDFDDAPKVPHMPQGCLWGFFDKDGKKDEVGTINLLTPANLLLANKEIRTGRRVQLDWSLDNVNFPGIGRKEFEHKMIDLEPHGFVALDDEIYMNTQSGSQWDGLKHAANQTTRLYYNGVSHQDALTTPTNGTHRWVEGGGIAGRGVLLDWLRWWEHQNRGESPKPYKRFEIKVEELDEVARYQGVTLRQGDIMMVRSGFVRWHNGASKEERKAGTRDGGEAIGLEANDKSVRWLYNYHFAAVVGDTFAFEAWPPPENVKLHEWLLAHWGTPIGEMWNLEQLSQECERHGRWSFFLTSAPLHIVGGVGSPPGAIAIF